MKQNNENIDIVIIDDVLPRLDEELEQNLIAFANDVWKKSAMGRQQVPIVNYDTYGSENQDATNILPQTQSLTYDLSEKIEEVARADSLKYLPTTYAMLEPWQSKIFLGWARQAHIAVAAYLYGMLLGGNWFTIRGAQADDEVNAERMSAVLKNFFDTNVNAKLVIKQVLQQLVKRGNTCVKGLWKLIKGFYYDYEPIGEPIETEAGIQTNTVGFRRIKKEVDIYNAPELEYIDIFNFHFFPFTGNFSEATKVYSYHKTIDELIGSKGQYNSNLEKLAEQYSKNTNDNSTSNGRIVDLKEMWITKAQVGDTTLDNIYCIIANDKWIIKFAPNPYDYGECPYMWAPFDIIEGTNFGKGLCFESIDILHAANRIINTLIDQLTIGSNPATLVPDSESPDKFVNEPNVIIPIDEKLWEQGKLPHRFEYSFANLPFNFQSVSMLKTMFDAETVPEFMQGIRPDKDETATRDQLVQQGGENKLSLAANNVNDCILKPLVRFIYGLFRQRSQVDPNVKLDMAKLVIPRTEEEEIPNPETGEIEKQLVEKSPEELLQEFGNIYPLDLLDIIVDGFKTNSAKQQQFMNTQQVLQLLPQASPELLQQLKEKGIFEQVLISLDFNPEDWLMSEDELEQRAQELGVQQAQIIEKLQQELQKAQEQLRMTEQYIQQGGANAQNAMPNVQQQIGQSQGPGGQILQV